MASTRKSKKPARTRRPAPRAPRRIHTLAVDVGGSGLKASVLDEKGKMLVERVRVTTPRPCPPGLLVETLARLVEPLPTFHRVSVGFPGVVRDGRVLTAINLGPDRWRGFDLASALEKRLGKPVRILNDADMQGFAAIEGKGVEMVVTLGTGFGTALFRDGELMPHLEIAHLPFRKGLTFEQYIGDAARKRCGKTKWSQRVVRVVDTLRNLVNWDRIHIGGGNAKHLTEKFPRDVKIVENSAGILGGIALWRSARV